MPFLNLKTCDLYYETHGEGEPLVAISGYTCDHTTWTSILEPLAKNFRVILLDNAGSGRTTDKDPSLPLTVQRISDDIIGLLNHLNIQKASVIGHSMGGSIAQYLASAHPERINKLGLLATSAKWRQASMRAMHASILLRKNNVDIDLLIENIEPWLFGEEFLSQQLKVENFRRLLLQNPYPQSLEDQERQYNILKEFDSNPYLKNIHSPTLIVHGVEDLLSLPYESEYLAKNIFNSELITLQAGHVFIDEVPKDLSKILINFLKDES